MLSPVATDMALGTYSHYSAYIPPLRLNGARCNLQHYVLIAWIHQLAPTNSKEQSHNLLAVAASESVLARLRTVTCTMTRFFAVDTFDLNTVRSLDPLLRARFADMSKLYYSLVAVYHIALKRLPSQLLHFGMPLATGIPASSSLFLFSSGFLGHHCFRCPRVGFSLK